jgi:hypothetical protein
LAVVRVTTGKNLTVSGARVFSDLFGVAHIHGPRSTDQQIFGHRHGGFGRTVHGGHQLIYAATLPQCLQQFGCILQITRQRNANFFISKESICFPQHVHGCQSAFLQSHFETL